MKTIFIFIFCTLLCACQTVSDLAKDNPLLVTIAVRNGVAQFINAAEPDKQALRAISTRAALEKIKLNIGDNETIKINDLLAFSESLIDFKSLSFSDRLLIQDLLLIVSSYFKTPEIKEDQIIVLVEILETAINTTYLVQ